MSISCRVDLQVSGRGREFCDGLRKMRRKMKGNPWFLEKLLSAYFFFIVNPPWFFLILPDSFFLFFFWNFVLFPVYLRRDVNPTRWALLKGGRSRRGGWPRRSSPRTRNSPGTSRAAVRRPAARSSPSSASSGPWFCLGTMTYFFPSLSPFLSLSLSLFTFFPFSLFFFSLLIDSLLGSFFNWHHRMGLWKRATATEMNWTWTCTSDRLS